MKVTVEDISTVKKRLLVEIPPEEVSTVVEETYRRLQREVSIDGFRRGKVPRAILESRYKGYVEGEVVTKLIEESYPRVVKEQRVTPVARPEIEVKDMKADQAFSYVATVEVRPEVKVEGYIGMEVKEGEVEVKEDEVERGIELLRERHARFKALEEDRGVRDGDLVVIDFEGTMEGIPIKTGKAVDHPLVVGTGVLLPEFERGLVGMKKGEERMVSVSFPSDYREKGLAGKVGQFKVLLKDIKERVLPPMDDEFAKDLEFEALEQLKARVRVNILKEKKMAERERVKREILKRLLEVNIFEVPQSLVETYLRHIVANLLERHGEEGAPLDVGLPPEGFRTRYTKMAEERVKGDIIIDSIARQEGIEVSQEELVSRVRELATERKVDQEVFEKRLKKEGVLDVMKEGLLEDKVFDFILSKVNPPNSKVPVALLTSPDASGEGGGRD